MKDDIYFMKIANKEGEKALKRDDYPAGCVIVSKGKIIAKASSTSITKKDPTSHGEINAIRKACKKLNSMILDNCILYTNIEPCLMCAKAIVYSKIKKVVFGTEHKEYGNNRSFDILKSNGVGKDISVMKIESKEALRLLNNFLKN